MHMKREIEYELRFLTIFIIAMLTINLITVILILIFNDLMWLAIVSPVLINPLAMLYFGTNSNIFILINKTIKSVCLYFIVFNTIYVPFLLFLLVNQKTLLKDNNILFLLMVLINLFIAPIILLEVLNKRSLKGRYENESSILNYKMKKQENIEGDYERDYYEGSGNTESSSEQYKLPNNEVIQGISLSNKSEIGEKANDKDIKQIGYDKRPEKVKTRSDEQRVES